MTQLRITCFHVFHATIDEQPVAFRSNKGRALLLYLAVEQRAHNRSALAGLLWPDLPENHARRNLSQTLLEVRKAIGDQTLQSPFLQTTAQQLSIATGDLWVDATIFEQTITGNDYAQATALYTGLFLADFMLPDSDLWEEWAERKREHYQQLALDAFLHLGLSHEADGRWEEALTTIRRLLTFAPWHEAAHCALMRLLARTGQRSAALAQYDTLTALLMDEFGVAPAPETDTLYDQIVAGELESIARPRMVAPSAAADQRAVPFHPPAPPPHFVGRSDEIALLCEGLCRSDQPVWAVVGMGGLGKTALALYVAHELRATFTDGMLWANTAISNPLDILNQWGRAFGCDLQSLPDLESRAAAMRGILAEKRVLLVLDNADAISTLTLLLPNTRDCRVLITTRSLDLAHALNSQILALGQLAGNGGYDLLAAILGTARVQAEAEAAHAICHILHSLPLALEIVAQRLRARTRITLAAMVERLSTEGQRLGLAISDRAVRTSFAISWDGLDDAQQRAFAHMALFAGRPFMATTFSYLLNADHITTEDLLYDLVALSLLQAEGESYFCQHPLLADFASEKLGTDDEAHRRYIRYYLHFATEKAHLHEALEAEWGNLADAVAKAHSLGAWQSVLDFVELLAEAWLTRARFDEAKAIYALAIDAATAQDAAAAKANIALRWAEICIEQSDYITAKQLLQQALPFYQQHNETAGISAIQFHLGSIAQEQGKLAEAEELIHACLRLRRANDDKIGIAAAVVLQANIAYDRDDFAQAKALAESALQLQLEADDQQNRIGTLRLLSSVAAQLGNDTEAVARGREALALGIALKNEHETATNLYALAAILRYQRNFQAAMTYAEDALTLAFRLGLRRLEGQIRYQLSAIHKEMEAYVEATRYAQQCIAIFTQVQDPLGLVYAQIHLGDLYHLQGEEQQSHACWQAARELGAETDNPWVSDEIGKRLPLFTTV